MKIAYWFHWILRAMGLRINYETRIRINGDRKAIKTFVGEYDALFRNENYF